MTGVRAHSKETHTCTLHQYFTKGTPLRRHFPTLPSNHGSTQPSRTALQVRGASRAMALPSSSYCCGQRLPRIITLQRGSISAQSILHSSEKRGPIPPNYALHEDTLEVTVFCHIVPFRWKKYLGTFTQPYFYDQILLSPAQCMANTLPTRRRG